jgi:hypothetical protein
MAIRVATVGSLLLVLFTVPAPAIGQESTLAPEELESADIAGDHALLADYFRAMAIAARSRSRLYDELANSSDSGEKRASLVARHYEKLGEQYRAMAEYDALASIHEEEASEAR